MGATNTTTYYNLSQFIGTDKPAWLQDYNGDMLKIDTGINAAKVAADAAALAAGTAQSTADGAVNSVSTLASTVSTHTSQITSLSGAVNTINSLIGNGTPTTTDQTIIGAINEINANISDSVSVTMGATETWAQAMTRLFALIPSGKVFPVLEVTIGSLTTRSSLEVIGTDGTLTYIRSMGSASSISIYKDEIGLTSHKSINQIANGGTITVTDQSSNTSSGSVLTLKSL